MAGYKFFFDPYNGIVTECVHTFKGMGPHLNEDKQYGKWMQRENLSVNVLNSSFHSNVASRNDAMRA